MRNFGSSLFISISIAVVLRSAKTSYAYMAERTAPNALALDLQQSIYTIWSVDGAAAQPDCPARSAGRPA